MADTKRVNILIDWKKEGAFIGAEYRLQLGGYFLATHCYDKTTQQTAIKPDVNIAMIVHVGENGVKPALVLGAQELADAVEAFKQALSLYRYIEKHFTEYDRKQGGRNYNILGVEDYVSVTTITKYVIAKPGLIAWAAKMAKEGKDPEALKQAGADTGTRIHRLVEFYLKGREVDLTDAPDWMVKASVHMAAWCEKHRVEPVLVEQVVYHPELKYAGTLDTIINGEGFNV